MPVGEHGGVVGLVRHRDTEVMGQVVEHCAVGDVATLFEQGIAQGERRSALRLMEAKFGPLSTNVKQRIEALSANDLARLQIDLLKAQSLEELRLND